jgi:flagellar protein FlgJ
MSDLALPSGFDPSILHTRAGATPTLKNGMSVDKAAADFEAMFLSQMLSHMWEGVDVDPNFGGGHGEEMFRSMMIEQQGKLMVRAGGVGIARHIKEAMLRMQEQSDQGGVQSTARNFAQTGAAAYGAAAP